MPHAGLMNEEALGPEAGPLQRARLHIRGGKRRLRQGKISAGIVTLYDAFLSAMKWYIASQDRRTGLMHLEGEDLSDDKTLFSVLERSGIVRAFDYTAFDALVDRALEGEMPGFDYSQILAAVESAMTSLGVMPFDEKDLPPEDPSTY